MNDQRIKIKRRMIGTGIAVLTCCTLSCTDAERASKLKTYGHQFRVVLYSGGDVVRCWESTGKVSGRNSSDRWEFVDSTTGKFVSVTGAVTVEEEKLCSEQSI